MAGGWFYLSTILDDYSRCIIAWKQCTAKKAQDSTGTLDLVLSTSECDQATDVRKSGLFGDSGSSYVAADLADFLNDKSMVHGCGAPNNLQTQGKVEHWHQMIKKRVLLENHFLPSNLGRQIVACVDHYNTHRFYENPENLTPADVCNGYCAKILTIRKEIKKRTI